MLSREQFFAFSRPANEEIQVPALGGSVFVKPLTAGERDAFEAENARVKGKDFRARIVVATAVDEAGKPLFTAADVSSLSGLPAYVLDPIATASVKVNKLTDDDVAELEKN